MIVDSKWAICSSIKLIIKKVCKKPSMIFQVLSFLDAQHEVGRSEVKVAS